MKPVTALLPLAFLVLAGGCETYKSRSVCDGDIDRLKDTITATTLYLDALRPELRAGFRELQACDRISEECDAEVWLYRARAMRLEHQSVHAAFTRAVELWQPEVCLPHLQSYNLNPPDPATWQGYFFTLEETSDQIEELIDRFERRLG
ncbi:MAG: hypothetical protein CME85_05810 [Henriciella sp.]|uniref:hypothetical protein n=1 Tax=Henriciella sp. TaxID=1968823 RepID=UPI000C0EF675|nr:hypothetical protein [Henriciella sp.]MBK74999.1 hypothetical protein [Henriciella sp.]PHR75069.1 MAG: hypothetical protein COA64_12850 [Henriciella sp.]